MPAYIRFIDKTTKWEYVGTENWEHARDNPQGMIVSFWHSRILMMVNERRNYPKPFWFMVSEHRDGEYIARAVEGFDIQFARGSARNPRKMAKNKSGSNAFRILLRALKRGEGVGLTPDGPRGPARKCHQGLAQLAIMSGVPVYPVAYSVQRAKFMSTWDRFHFPLPFSKGCFVYGPPIHVDRSEISDIDSICVRIAEAINTVTDEADRRMGHISTESISAPVEAGR